MKQLRARKEFAMESSCACCGMLCKPLEFHPYAACLMFKACKNGDTVRANLAFVVEYGKSQALQRAQEETRDAQTRTE
jgi:hypothetical protein